LLPRLGWTVRDGGGVLSGHPAMDALAAIILYY